MTDMLKDKKIKEWTFNSSTQYLAKKGYTTGMLFSYHSLYNGHGTSEYPAATVDYSMQYTYNAKLLERRVDTVVTNATAT